LDSVVTVISDIPGDTVACARARRLGVTPTRRRWAIPFILQIPLQAG
jgi:hypothetical protein